MTDQVVSSTPPKVTNLKKKKVIDSPFLPEDFFMMVIGVVVIGLGLKGFIIPNKFFDGGTTGISLLIQQIYHFDLEYVIILVNIPLLIMGIYTINLKFAIKSLLCIIALSICLKFIPYPIITNDKLLIAIFGGFFLGLGIGFCMRAGCAFDGMEILALYTWKKTSFTITEIIMAINILIFTIAAFKFGKETSLYSIITYFTATRTIDYVIEGWEAYTGVTIISSKSEEIKQKLVNEMRRGITVYKGERGFLPGSYDVSYDCDIIFTIATRLEVRRLKNVIHSIDPKAFVYVSIIRETSGGIIKRKNMHH